MVGTARDAPLPTLRLRVAPIPRSIQRDARRISAEVRRRVERLAFERAVVELLVKGLRRREGVVGELAVARQNFGAAVEPGALADVDAGVRPLHVGDVGTAGAVIG